MRRSIIKRRVLKAQYDKIIDDLAQEKIVPASKDSEVEADDTESDKGE